MEFIVRAPAICNDCGTIFPSICDFENFTNISFNSCTSGPCPVCSGVGRIPDGIYNFIGNAIELLSGPKSTVTQLQRLAHILIDAKNNNLTSAEVSSAISAATPELSSLKDWLPTTRNELYAFTAIILTIIAMLISQFSSSEPKQIEINNVINNIYLESDNSKKSLVKPKK
jgi:hypothetical protein